MKNYDLEQRTSQFGKLIIIHCKQISPTSISKPILSQLIRSGTSIGANYREANAATSKKDFRNKIHLCKKEAQETIHWLEMLATVIGESGATINKLIDECQQLILIFGKIISTLKKSSL